jgi:hypothetical protein
VLWPGTELAFREGEKLLIAFLAVLPHPAARKAAADIAASRARLPVKRRMPDPFGLAGKGGQCPGLPFRSSC